MIPFRSPSKFRTPSLLGTIPAYFIGFAILVALATSPQVQAEPIDSQSFTTLQDKFHNENVERNLGDHQRTVDFGVTRFTFQNHKNCTYHPYHQTVASIAAIVAEQRRHNTPLKTVERVRQVRDQDQDRDRVHYRLLFELSLVLSPSISTTIAAGDTPGAPTVTSA